MVCPVVQVKPNRNFTVYVYFADGKIKLYDLSAQVGHGIFEPLASVDFFLERCTVLNDTLAWDLTGNFDPHLCIDISPETIYADGVDVGDPFSTGVA